MIVIDEDKISLKINGIKKEYSIGTPEGFKIISDLWLRSGWDTKYVYSFSWLGRPIIQLPDDMLRIQELIFSLKPDVIIETGIAHGGSLIFYASLCKLMGKGRVIGVDVEIRPHNRKAIEEHELYEYITMFEGNSTDPEIINKIKNLIGKNDKVFICLDSCHTKKHVLEELRTYSPFVSKGSYIVAMDGIMENLVNAPRTNPEWIWDNPRQAALEFVKGNKEFIINPPKFIFNEGTITERVTYWLDGFIQRIR